MIKPCRWAATLVTGYLGIVLLASGCNPGGSSAPPKPTDSNSYVQGKLNDPNTPPEVKEQLRKSLEKPAGAPK